MNSSIHNINEPDKINRVLSLDGKSYMEICDSELLNNIGFQVTMEAWIKPTAFMDEWMIIIYKGDKRISDACSNRSYMMSLNNAGFIHLASAQEGKPQIYINSLDGSIALDNWYHIVGVIDAKIGVMRIFINGVEFAKGDFGNNIHKSALPLQIGHSTAEEERPEHSLFAGQIDEVRIWNVARTQEEIQKTIHTMPSGEEPGLVAYWQFDDVQNPVKDSSMNHLNGKLVGGANLIEARLPGPDEIVKPDVLYGVVYGVVTDVSGKPAPNALVSIEKDREEIKNILTNDFGHYRILKLSEGLYDLYATSREYGSMRLDIPLHPGESLKLDLTLKKAITSISGTLLMLDDKTPHIAVQVQLMRDGKLVATTLSDENGKYRLSILPPDQYKVRCYVLNGYVCSEYFQVQDGMTFSNIDFRFTPFKKGTWRNYNYMDGLAGNGVFAIYHDPDGMMWFGTNAGVSRYDGKEFVNFTTKDGLPHNRVNAISRGQDGAMWFGTWEGLSRYDGSKFTNFTTENGLTGGNVVRAIYRDADGVMWFATGFGARSTGGVYGGVSRYDGEKFEKLTEENGLAINNVHAINRSPDGIMWFGTWDGGISRYDDKITGDAPRFINFATKDGLVNDLVRTIHFGPDGVMWIGTSAGVSRFDNRDIGNLPNFVNFTTRDGLAHNIVHAIYSDADGAIWFGAGSWRTDEGGLSRYDGRGFVNFTQEDGLINNRVNAIYQDSDHVMWFGTWDGLSRYDPESFVSFTVKDGLAHNHVNAIYQDPDGAIWFGTWGGGISRYKDTGLNNSLNFVNLTTEDGLDNNYISSIHRDLHGIMWFGTMHGIFWYDGKNFHKLHIKLGSSDVLQGASFYAIHGDSNGVMWFGTADIEREAERGEGVLIYDGEEFTRITTEGGLANGGVCAIHRDQDGIMWFGTTMGVYRYGGENISRFTKKDGLANNYVNVIHCDPDGTVWFGTQDGVSRYAGKEFFNFTTEDGLAHNDVNAIYRDASGIIWFATYGGGVSGYDGIAWITLDTRDGLAGKTVTSILEDKDGFLWFGTDEGVTRYRRSISKPKVYIVSVTADQTYTDFSAIPAFTPGTRITVEYSSIDFKTLPAKRQYRYRIKETDSDWRKPTKETSSDFIFDNPGTYTFEVQAIDRDLNYSEPMSLKLEVIPDPRNHQIAQLKGELAERERAEMQRMQQELDDAHDMQMSLMPGKPPILEGFEIAGFSKPAREVGGDFFDYFTTVDGKTGIALADVSGKGLKGAMNAVLANGIIHEVARTRNSCGSILRALNDSLCPRMMKLMFIAVELVIIDKDNMTMQWANAGQPYPIVRRKGKAFELVTDNEIPAGIMRDITYSDRQFSFESGDVVVFYTDGLMEAENEAGEMYGSERLQQTMMDINSMESPEEIIKVILQSISDFVGEAEQYDDMTIVVIKRK